MLRKGDRMICGVCSGIANYFGVDANIIRIVWLWLCIGLFLTPFLGFNVVLLYFICAVIMPDNK